MSDVTLKKKDEYFLSIAKQGTHSFMMLGVVVNDAPKLLARVGKRGEIDPGASSTFTIIKKAILTRILSRLADEGVFRRSGHVSSINYQAYEINYEQVKEFLGMIYEIEEKQNQNPVIRDAIKRKYGDEGIEQEAIECFVPIEESGDVVTFRLKKLNEYEFLATEELKVKINSEIISGVQEININNTCRTSSKNIVESILGFVTDVSNYFFIALKHESKLIAGQPEKESFYILPPPPNCENISKKQNSILKKTYKRLEEMPKLNPNSPETRNKFNALRAMYKNIAGENKLSAKELLEKILEHEYKNQNSLFEKRSPNFFSRIFSISSSTKRMLDDMESNLKRVMTSQEVNEVKNKFKIKSDIVINSNEERIQEPTDSISVSPPYIKY